MSSSFQLLQYTHYAFHFLHFNYYYSHYSTTAVAAASLPLTNSVVPSVDGEEAAAGDGDHGGHGEVRQGVGGHVRHGRVGRKLQHHDDVLLHLVLEHERALRKERLLRGMQRRGNRNEEGKT